MGTTIKQLDNVVAGLEERTAENEKTLSTIAESVAKVLDRFQNIEAALAGMSAQNRPTTHRSGFEDAQEIGDPNETGMAYFDESEGELVKSRITDVESPEFRAKEAALAFDRQLLDIFIQDTSEKQADPCFTVGVNGRVWTFWRGQRYTVPRYVVGVLAGAKPDTFTNEEYTSNDGVRGIRWPKRRGLRYGFSVERDPAGDAGRAWLEAALAAA